MIEAVGHTTQSLGIGRVIGQIFAYLYFSKEPQSLDDLTAALGISKGSASIGVRQLEQWKALEKIPTKGDRKDYYRARDELGTIVRNAVRDLARSRIENSSGLIKNAMDELDRENGDDPQNDFIKERVANIDAFQRKAESMWNGTLVNMLLE